MYVIAFCTYNKNVIHAHDNENCREHGATESTDHHRYNLTVCI